MGSFFFFFFLKWEVSNDNYGLSFSVSDDHSRVKLQNAENDYINASLVDIEEAQRSYILTQASDVM